MLHHWSVQAANNRNMREKLERLEFEHGEEERMLREQRHSGWQRACQITLGNIRQKKIEANRLRQKIEDARQQRRKQKEEHSLYRIEKIRKYQSDWQEHRSGVFAASQMESMECYLMSREDIESKRYDSFYRIEERNKKKREKKKNRKSRIACE
jgi:hypothetical protein